MAVPTEGNNKSYRVGQRHLGSKSTERGAPETEARHSEAVARDSQPSATLRSVRLQTPMLASSSSVLSRE
jgi:hypothetical protein